MLIVKALKCQMQVLSFVEKTYGKNKHGVVPALHQMAVCYFAIGNRKQVRLFNSCSSVAKAVMCLERILGIKYLMDTLDPKVAQEIRDFKRYAEQGGRKTAYTSFSYTAFGEG